jgi:proteasome alpha subunit
MYRRKKKRYDRLTTVFSPKGRLYQVEYACELVKKSAPIIGVKSPEGAVLAAVEGEKEPLVSESECKKFSKIDEHLGAAIAGLKPDARVLINKARLICQNHRLTYDEPMDIMALVWEIGNRYQTFTQNARMRPFGVSMILGGVDLTGVKIVSINPSGRYRMYNADARGRYNGEAKKLLKDVYSEGVSLDEAQDIAVEALKAASTKELLPEQVNIAVVPTRTKRYKELTTKEVSKYL